MPTLYLICGPSGCGKSTYVKNHRKWNESNTVHVSRDAIRFLFVSEEARENYFDKEDAVYDTFVDMIHNSLHYGFDTYADATHLTPKARRKLLNGIDVKNMKDVRVVAIDCGKPADECIKQNSEREGWANVPDKVIKEMCDRYVPPTTDEPYISEVIKPVTLLDYGFFKF